MAGCWDGMPSLDAFVQTSQRNMDSVEPIAPDVTGAEQAKPTRSVAIVLHFLSHYREAVYRRLTDTGASQHRYVIYSDTASNIPSLKVIDFDSRAASTPTPGRITWRRVTRILQQ